MRLLGPLTVDHAMELANMVEDKFKFGKSKRECKSGMSPISKASSYMSHSAFFPRSHASSLLPSPKSYASYVPSGVSTGSSPLPVAKPMGSCEG